MNEYNPVSCKFFDKIEDLAERKMEVSLEYYDADYEFRTTVGHITNIFTEDKQEFLVIDYDDEVRLDHIRQINDTKGPAYDLRSANGK